jgi:uncharacterized membrane protein
MRSGLRRTGIALGTLYIPQLVVPTRRNAVSKNKNLPKPDKAPLESANDPINAAVTASLPAFYSAQVAHMQQSTGPIPAPDVMRKYEELNPGFANRIMKMAEDEAAHRRAMESHVIELQGQDQRAYRRSELCGSIFGLTIGLAALGVAIAAIIMGSPMAGGFIGTTGVTGLVTSFILGRTMLSKQRRQDQEHQRELAAIQKDAGQSNAK